MQHSKFQLVCIISVKIKKRRKCRLSFCIRISVSFGRESSYLALVIIDKGAVDNPSCF